MALIEVKVPDIGDFDEVSVIELLVQPGDTVKPEQSLVTVESDKASMEIPSSAGGVVRELKVKLGDKVKEGSVLVVLESTTTSPPPGQDVPPAPTLPRHGGGLEKHCRSGAGPSGRPKCAQPDRSPGARHRRLQGRGRHRTAGQARRRGHGRTVAAHRGIGQGLDGDSLEPCRRDQGVEGQAWRQVERRRPGRSAGRHRRRRSCRTGAGFGQGVCRAP